MDKTVLDRITSDFAYFAKLFFEVDLADWQRQAAEWDGNVVASCGRGSGKTLWCVMRMTHKCLTQPGTLCLYMSGKSLMASEALNVVKVILMRTPLWAEVKSSSQDGIDFKNGSRIKALPQAETAVRGWHGEFRGGKAPGAVVSVYDEAESIREEVWVAGLGTQTSSANDQRIVLGSGGSPEHWFAGEYEKARDNPDVLALMVSTEELVDTVFVDKKALDSIRKSYVSDVQYDVEIGGRFLSGANRFFREHEILRAMTDEEMPIPYNPASTYCVGVDWSSSTEPGSDFTVLCVVERMAPEPSTKKLKRAREEQNQYLVDTGQVAAWQVPRPEGDDDSEKRPVYRVACIRRFQYLSSVDFKYELVALQRLYPGLNEMVFERYEHSLLDLVVSGKIRAPKDPNMPGRQKVGHGQGSVPINVTIASTGTDSQYEAFSILSRVIRDGELRIPKNGLHAQTFKNELLTFGVGLTEKQSRWRFGKGALKGKKVKDDTCYACAWALFGLRRISDYHGMSIGEMVQFKQRRHGGQRDRQKP